MNETLTITSADLKAVFDEWLKTPVEQRASLEESGDCADYMFRCLKELAVA